MILVIRPDATLDQIEHVIERVKELGFTPHVSRGESRTIVGVIGDETKPQAQNFSAIPGVEQVLPIMKPFKLASRWWWTRSRISEQIRICGIRMNISRVSVMRPSVEFSSGTTP